MTHAHGSNGTPVTTTATTTITAVDTPADEGPQCDMCSHDWAAHDRIGARFCTASRASGRTDGVCVCRH